MFYSRYSVIALAVVILGGVAGVAVDRLPVNQLTRAILVVALTWNISLWFAKRAGLFVSPDASATPRPARTAMEVFRLSLIAALVATAVHYALAWPTLGMSDEIRQHQTVLLGVLGTGLGTFQGCLGVESEKYE